MNRRLVSALVLLAGLTTHFGDSREDVVSASASQIVLAQGEEPRCSNDAEPDKVHQRSFPAPVDWQKIKVAPAQKTALLKAEYESILAELRVRYANDPKSLAAADLTLRRELFDEPIK